MKALELLLPVVFIAVAVTGPLAVAMELSSRGSGTVVEAAVNPGPALSELLLGNFPVLGSAA